MKTKHKNCVVAPAAGVRVGVDVDVGVRSGVTEKMKSVILYPYGPLMGTGCCRMLHAKNLAITSAIYTINISLLIVLIYCWRINVNIRRSGDLEDVYYGVQIAYFAIIGTQMSMIVLSIVLIFGIYKENPGLIVPWIIGYITFMALEAVAMVYSNVLRDHVNKQFDAMCKAEVAFFIARAFINVLAMWGVLRFYNLVRSGITWKGPEAKTALSAASMRARPAGSLPATMAGYQRGGGGGGGARYCVKHKYHHRDISYGERRSTGCCAFLDFDDYDDDDEDCCDADGEYDYDDYYCDDDDYDDGVGDVGDYDPTVVRYDFTDENGDGSDCAMLGRGRGTNRRTRHCIATCSGGGGGGGGGGSNKRNRQRCNDIRSVLINKRHQKYKMTQPKTRLEVINESERSVGSGSDENDSLLVAYDSSSSMASV